MKELLGTVGRTRNISFDDFSPCAIVAADGMIFCQNLTKILFMTEFSLFVNFIVSVAISAQGPRLV